jgi:hypothetical protein
MSPLHAADYLGMTFNSHTTKRKEVTQRAMEIRAFLDTIPVAMKGFAKLSGEHVDRCEARLLEAIGEAGKAKAPAKAPSASKAPAKAPKPQPIKKKAAKRR